MWSWKRLFSSGSKSNSLQLLGKMWLCMSTKAYQRRYFSIFETDLLLLRIFNLVLKPFFPPGGTSKTTMKPSKCGGPGVYFNSKGERCHCQTFNKTPAYNCTKTTTSTGVEMSTSSGTTGVTDTASSDYYY